MPWARKTASWARKARSFGVSVRVVAARNYYSMSSFITRDFSVMAIVRGLPRRRGPLAHAYSIAGVSVLPGPRFCLRFALCVRMQKFAVVTAGLFACFGRVIFLSSMPSRWIAAST